LLGNSGRLEVLSSHLLSASPVSLSYNPFFLFQFLSQRKKQEAEERRSKLKNAREEFKQMLEVCCLLLVEISTISIHIIYFFFLSFSYLQLTFSGVHRPDIIHKMEVCFSLNGFTHIEFFLLIYLVYVLHISWSVS
jgi:hypothetical protein